MLRLENRPCCPVPAHPRLPEIRAGLADLPRQLTGFPDYRRAMLAAIPTMAELDGWRADGAHDLGVMLIEAWAYVLDITGFYDKIIADRSYVGTALDDVVMRELVALIGYSPRPAMVARALLALEAQGEDKVVAAAATGFRSQGFDAEPPQVFELAAPADIWPQRNKWTLAPHRTDVFDGTLRFPSGSAPNVGAVMALTSGASRFAGKVAAVETTTEADKLKYQKVRFESGSPAALAGVPLSTLKADLMTMRAAPTPLMESDAFAGDGFLGPYAVLDGLYPQIGRGGPLVVEVNGVLHATTILWSQTYPHLQPVGDVEATIPLTVIFFESIGAIPSDASAFFHVMPRRLGTPTRPAETAITLDMIRASGRLEKPVKPLGTAPWAGNAIAAGGKAKGALMPGQITFGADASPAFVPDAGAVDFAEPLLAPVAIYGNVVEAIRGETVGDEVLGSADASIAGQRFKLRKKPLSWIEDASRGLGRAPQLTVRVDGLAWTYVESFYDRKKDERIYRIEMAADGVATIVFGDGVRGARPNSGVANVTASYRWGAGAAKPPAGSFKQFARPSKGLARVSGPLSAFGGADAETAGELRTAGPSAMLSLGRAVSVADFEAMTRSYSGVANSAVAYSWDGVRHEAVIMIWIIADAGDPSNALADFLRARAVPGLAVKAAPALPVIVPVFDVTIEAADGYAPDAVRAAVRAALFDPATGFLSPRRIAISAPLFRSHLLAAIHAVPGVKAVTSIAIQSGQMPKAMTLSEGQYFDFLTYGEVL